MLASERRRNDAVGHVEDVSETDVFEPFLYLRVGVEQGTNAKIDGREHQNQPDHDSVDVGERSAGAEVHPAGEKVSVVWAGGH